MVAVTPTFVLATALTAAPAHAADSPVDIAPVGVKNLDVGLSGASFDVVLEAERTRGWLPLKLRSVDYVVMVGKAQVATGTREYDGLKLKKGDPVRFRVPVELSGGEALTAMGRIASGRSVKVKVKGTAGLGIFFIPIKVPFSAKMKSR